MKLLLACGMLFGLLALASCSATGTSGPGTFGRSASEAEEISDPSVVQRDFQVTYKLEGASADSDFVGLITNRQLAFSPSVPDGASIAEGEEIGSVRVDPDRSVVLSDSSSSIDTSRIDQLKSMEGPVAAPVSGVLDMTGLFAVVRSHGIDVVIPITPLQDLRIQSMTFSGDALIETVMGQRQVGCVALWTQQGGGSIEGEASPTATTELHCRLPSYLETAAGLRAQVILQSEVVENAVLVPNLYIDYDDTNDSYYINVAENGAVSTITVRVGVTDGIVRVITSDAPVGAILVRPEDP